MNDRATYTRLDATPVVVGARCSTVLGQAQDPFEVVAVATPLELGERRVTHRALGIAERRVRRRPQRRRRQRQRQLLGGGRRVVLCALRGLTTDLRGLAPDLGGLAADLDGLAA